MMGKFKAGEIVRAIRETTSLSDRHPAGSEYVVGESQFPEVLNPKEFVAGPDGNPSRYIFPEEDFELVPVLDLSKVKAGDTVTVTQRTATVTDEVTLVSQGPHWHFDLKVYPSTVILGVPGVDDGLWTLTAHQPAPEPEPEWEPEAIVRATVNGVPDTLLMRLTPGYEGGFVWATPTLTPRRPENEQSWLLYEDADVTDVRPLVVIDPATVNKDILATKAFTSVSVVERVLEQLGIEA